MKKRVKSNMKNRIKFDLCVAACAAALVGFSAFGELTPKSWNGGASGDWGVDANWAPAGVPTADDAVTIGSGVVTASNLTVSVGSLTMGSGATLTVYAEAVDNSQDLTAFAGDGAVVNVAGDLALQSGAWIVPIAEPVSGGTVRFNVGSAATFRLQKAVVSMQRARAGRVRMVPDSTAPRAGATDTAAAMAVWEERKGAVSRRERPTDISSRHFCPALPGAVLAVRRPSPRTPADAEAVRFACM